MTTNKLVSAAGVDYRELDRLLAIENWKVADEETFQVMLKAARREKDGWLDINGINKFPCEDLRIIDQLWVKHSNSCFGFSVQKRIYQNLGGTKEYDKKKWQAFCEQVGWRKVGKPVYYSDVTFDIKAPVAHLPLWGGSCGLGTTGGGWFVGLGWTHTIEALDGGVGISSLVSRLVDCNI
ncbi:GUN4 domain-containing protein [Nostoc sp. 'Peltigera malacea cyanobiont' DB3992]|uniref:GUN4 domain-containing protein n=1 Tax=Nostoc sp. 'Peltigera malacea cyanobiont' DB3992 TaxID=1206980 RepID=UPI000C03F730|nr:GUN4 domain-containing protein [Nostoc sp. 'Peltigera malacea cyanobiont' DB3992]PHM10664.1 hypothetical protein CK516_07325 [Nostoc sp. 'Peltigera malacea cyanobiont' DB3992]